MNNTIPALRPASLIPKNHVSQLMIKTKRFISEKKTRITNRIMYNTRSRPRATPVSSMINIVNAAPFKFSDRKVEMKIILRFS